MNMLRYKISIFILLMMTTGCVNYPVMETGVIGAGPPVLSGKVNISTQGKTAFSITVEATISNENGEKITERGFFYGLMKDPKEDNGAIKISETDMNKRTGLFSMAIDGLGNNKVYYINSFARNAKGISYGPEEPATFITVEGIAKVETLEPDVEFIRASSAIVSGKLTEAGESAITKIGFLVFENGVEAKVDTFVYSKPVSVKETFKYQLTGLKPSTTYHARAFVINKYGADQGEIVSFLTRNGQPEIVGDIREIGKDYGSVTLSATVSVRGDETVTIKERGFCWSNTNVVDPDITNDHQSFGDGDGDFEGTIDGLKSNVSYSVRAYAISNFDVVAYGNTAYIYTLSDIPSVRTDSIRLIENGGANVGGIIYDKGNGYITEAGIYWSTNPIKPPFEATSNLQLYITNNYEFSGRLNRLRGGTTYYVCAYARNEKGIGYGEVRQFTTPPIFITSGFAALPTPSRAAGSMAYFSIGQYLYIAGGDLGASYTDELKRYNIEEDQWEDCMPFPGGPMKWQTALTYGNGALVYGGFNNKGDEKPGIYYYRNFPTNLWDYYDGPPDSAIVNRSVGYALSSDVFFIGGECADLIRKDVWNFYLDDKSWHKKTDFPVPQYGGVAAVIDGIAYVGMGNSAQNVCNNTLWITRNGARTWEYKTYYPISGSVLGSVVCNRRLYVIESGHNFLEYNPDTNSWTRKSTIPDGHKAIHCIYAIGNRIYFGLPGRAMRIYDPAWDN